MRQALGRLAPHRREAAETLHEARAGRIELVEHPPIPLGARPWGGRRDGDELHRPRGQRPGPAEPSAFGDLHRDVVGPFARRQRHVDGERVETLRGAGRAFLPGTRRHLVEEIGAGVGLASIGGVADLHPEFHRRPCGCPWRQERIDSESDRLPRGSQRSPVDRDADLIPRAPANREAIGSVVEGVVGRGLDQVGDAILSMAGLVGPTIRHEVDHDPRRLPIGDAEFDAIERAFGRLMNEHRPTDGVDPRGGQGIGRDQPPRKRPLIRLVEARQCLLGMRLTNDTDRPRPAPRLSPSPDDTDRHRGHRHSAVRPRIMPRAHHRERRHGLRERRGRGHPRQRQDDHDNGSHKRLPEGGDGRQTRAGRTVGHWARAGLAPEDRADGAGRIAAHGRPHHRCFPGRNTTSGSFPAAAWGARGPPGGFRRSHRPARGGPSKLGGRPRAPPRRSPSGSPSPPGIGC